MDGKVAEVQDGSVVIAAITSCTNTSNPSVMLAAGLLAKKAVEKRTDSSAARENESRAGLQSRHGLLPGCGTDSLHGEARLPPGRIRLYNLYRQQRTAAGSGGEAVQSNKLVVASVLSGNRNFEGRINPLVRANYLASPPLVVAYAIAGRVDIDLVKEPLGTDDTGKKVYPEGYLAD